MNSISSEFVCGPLIGAKYADRRWLSTSWVIYLTEVFAAILTSRWTDLMLLRIVPCWHPASFSASYSFPAIPREGFKSPRHKSRALSREDCRVCHSGSSITGQIVNLSSNHREPQAVLIRAPRLDAGTPAWIDFWCLNSGSYVMVHVEFLLLITPLSKIVVDLWRRGSARIAIRS